MKHLILLLAPLILLSSCYTSTKLENTAFVAIDDNMSIIIRQTGSSALSSYYIPEEYKQQFIDGMMGEFSYSNVQQVSLAEADYLVIIEELDILETTKPHTVDDPESNNHGQTYELTEVVFSAKGSVKNMNTGKVVNWEAEKPKEEKVTNNQSFGQWISGDNKDGEEYREKDIDYTQLLTLVEQCGRRSGVRVTKKIAKMM